MRSQVSQKQWLDNTTTRSAQAIRTTIPPCCLIARQTLRWSVCVLQVAASSWVCFSTAHFRKSNTTVEQDMQLQGLGSVCSKDSLALLADGFPCLSLVASTLHQILVHVARFVSSLMRWQRGAHVLGKTNPTSISGLRAVCWSVTGVVSGVS
jgi:hypothetical protein